MRIRATSFLFIVVAGVIVADPAAGDHIVPATPVPDTYAAVVTFSGAAQVGSWCGSAAYCAKPWPGAPGYGLCATGFGANYEVPYGAQCLIGYNIAPAPQGWSLNTHLWDSDIDLGNGLSGITLPAACRANGRLADGRLPEPGHGLGSSTYLWFGLPLLSSSGNCELSLDGLISPVVAGAPGPTCESGVWSTEGGRVDDPSSPYRTDRLTVRGQREGQPDVTADLQLSWTVSGFEGRTQGSARIGERHLAVAGAVQAVPFQPSSSSGEVCWYYPANHVALHGVLVLAEDPNNIDPLPDDVDEAIEHLLSLGQQADERVSDDCDGGSVADAYATDAYTKVGAVVPEGSGETWVCVRVDGNTVHEGVKVTLPTETEVAGAWVDDESGACPAPALVDQGVGNPGHPAYITLTVDTNSPPNEVWLCVNVDDQVRKRLRLGLVEGANPLTTLDVERDPYGGEAPEPLGQCTETLLDVTFLVTVYAGAGDSEVCASLNGRPVGASAQIGDL